MSMPYIEEYALLRIPFTSGVLLFNRGILCCIQDEKHTSLYKASTYILYMNLQET